jgi:uncharacterized membrane protein YbaN (DUF454 family)
MESASLKHAGLPDRIEPGEGDGVSPCLDIEFDERGGSVRVYDPRLFQAGRRGFCERLLEAASRQPGIHKAEVDLASASCQIEFSPGSTTSQCMADSFARAVREASAGSSWLDRVSWWRRRRGRWSALTAFRLPEGVSLWETFEVEAARIRLRRPGVTGNRARLSRLADTLADLEGVEACRVSPWFHRVTIDVCLDSPLSDRLLDTAEQALRGIRAADWLPPERRTHARTADADGEVSLVTTTGWKRLVNLALAGGSFAMTLVALAVPGIPTAPCLLATSDYLARSSPRLNDRLRHSLLFGPILRECEHHGGLSRFSKGKLTVLTLAIVSVTVVFAALTPVVLVFIVLISSLSIYGIARMSDLPDEPHRVLQLNGQAFLAPPAS